MPPCKLTVEKLAVIADQQHSTRRSVLDWLRVEYEVEKPSQKLQDPIALDSDAFVAEVKKLRGKSKPLSAAALKALERDTYPKRHREA